MRNQLPLQAQRQLQVLKNQVETNVIYGKNVFRSQFRQMYPQIEDKLKEILGKFYVRIERDRTTREIKFGVNGEVSKTTTFLLAFFQHLQRSSIKGYFFLGVQTPIFKEICRVQFTQLERLELIGCQINSLEPLTWINAVNFKSIYLRSNKITSLKPLQKTSFKNFTSIDLDNNFFNDSCSFCRMMTVNFDPAKNSKFYIYITESKHHIGNLNFILKMQNVRTSLIGENSNAGKYIKQPKVFNSIYRLQVEKKPNT